MTFNSPFDALEEMYLSEASWEEVEGQFSCQERNCYLVAIEAKYSDKHKVITWVCSDGHVSKLEDYIL